MFYYPEVLRRRTGCFGTIWLAATCCSRLLRREYLGVDVPRTCAAVELFVIGRGGWEVPPPPAGAPPPRCSLYLGALLQLGLARVYGRQCHILLEEVSVILERLHRAWRPLVDIDVSPPRRAQLLPDSRALMEALEAAPDPFFGVMGVELPQVEELLLPEEIEAPPELPPAEPFRISLPEAPPPAPPELPEVELPEVTPRELQLLLEAEEEIPELEMELPIPPRPAPPEEAPPLPAVPAPPPEAAPPPRPRRPRPPAPPPRPRPRAEPTQMGGGEMRERLGEPRGGCESRPLAVVPRFLRRSPAELLNNPGHALSPSLVPLWGRSFRPLPRPRAPPPEPPSEVEVLREALEPSLAPPSSEISLEPLEEEPSVPPLPAPPPEVLPEVPEAAPIDLRRLILDRAQAPEGAEFGAIVSPDWPRPLVARAFALCLELCASHWLQLEQPRPYGPIRIKLRPRAE